MLLNVSKTPTQTSWKWNQKAWIEAEKAIKLPSLPPLNTFKGDKGGAPSFKNF